MVLDTRWKRFKYSNGSKTLCVLLALVMVAVIALNGISLVKAFAMFGEEAFSSHKVSYKDSDQLMQSLYFDTDKIFSIIGLSTAEKEYYKAEAEYVEKALKAYKEETEKNRLSEEEVEKYIDRLHNEEDIYNEYYEEYYEGYDDRYYLSAYYNIYYGDDHYWYDADFSYESLKTVEIESYNIAFGHSDTKAESMFRDWFYKENHSTYVIYDDRVYYSNNLTRLKNVKFYAENDIVFTNVTENVQAFISNVKREKGITSTVKTESCL